MVDPCPPGSTCESLPNGGVGQGPRDGALPDASFDDGAPLGAPDAPITFPDVNTE